VPTDSAANNSVFGLMSTSDTTRTESACFFEFQCPVSCSYEKGCPCFEIMKGQLVFLQSKHFRWASIAKLLGISEQTPRRRREESELKTDGFTEISENNLTAVIQSVKSVTLDIGQSRILGALRSRGLRVQHWWVHEIMRKIDPVGTANWLKFGVNIVKNVSANSDYSFH